MFTNSLIKKTAVITVALSNLLSMSPCFAEDGATSPIGAMRTINGYLAGLAMKNGYIAPNNPQAAKVIFTKTAPTLSQAMTALHSIPQNLPHYSAETHTPTPTAEEVQFVTADPVAFDDASNMLLTSILPTDENNTDLDTFDILPDDYGSTDTLDAVADAYSADLYTAAVDGTASTLANIAGLRGLAAPTLPQLVNLVEGAASDTAAPSDSTAYGAKSNSLAVSQPSIALAPVGWMSAAQNSDDAAVYDNASPTNKFMLQGYVEERRQVASEKRKSDCVVYAAPGVKWVKEGNGLIQFSKGSAFFNSRRETTIETSCADIHASSGALVAVETVNGSTKVRACSGPGHITVTAGAQIINLNPGEEAWVTSKDVISKRDSLPADNIGRRRIARHNLPEGKTLILSEFSLSSFLNNAAYLPSHQSASQEDRKVAEKLLKTTVVLNS